MYLFILKINGCPEEMYLFYSREVSYHKENGVCKMLPLNQTAQKTNAPANISKTGRAILNATKPRANSAQATSFLRRRKVVQTMLSQAAGTYVSPEPKPDLKVYSDYPILEMSEDDAGSEGFNPEMDSIQKMMASPEHDECLANEYWFIQGAVNGSQMNQLPWSAQQTVHSMDM